MGGQEKAKLLCSFGGEIIREQGKAFYLGGKTRLVTIQRSSSFRSLLSKMSEVCDANPNSVELKYQLPDVSLDSRMMSIENDDDVSNMMDEFDVDRKIPIFLFTDNRGRSSAEVEEEDEEDEDEDEAEEIAGEDGVLDSVGLRETTSVVARGKIRSQSSSGKDYLRNPSVGSSMSGEVFHKNSQSLVVGQEYEDVQTFRNALTTAAIAANFELRMIRSDQRRVSASNNMARTKKRVTTVEVNENEGQGSEQLPEQSDSQLEVREGSTPTVKRQRGPTKLPDVWKMKNNERIVVEANSARQPVGDNAGKLAQFIGVVARNARIVPLSYESWPKVPDTTKAAAYSTIKQYFSYPNSLDNWVKKSLSKKWRDYKSDLKGKFYDKNRSEADNARVVPPSVEASDWQFLVHFWSSEKGQRRSGVGVASRAKQRVLHTAGRQSFAIVREKLEEVLGVDSIGDIDIFDATHRSKDGSFPTPAAEGILTNARKKYDEISTGSSESSAASSDLLARQRQAMIEVMGKERPGRVRGMGLGPTPSQVFGLRAPAYVGSQTVGMDQFVALQAQIAALQAQMDNLVRQQTNGSEIPVPPDGQTIPSVASRANLEVTTDHNGNNSVDKRCT